VLPAMLSLTKKTKTVSCQSWVCFSRWSRQHTSNVLEDVPRGQRHRSMMLESGVIRTEIIPVDEATYQSIGGAAQPLWGRAGKAEEVASLVSYLISDEASFISGTNIKADGLWSMTGGGMS